jgi:hypothetical protein
MRKPKRRKLRDPSTNAHPSTNAQDAPSTVDVPIADEGLITETTIYTTIAAIFEESIAGKPWFPQYSPGTQQTLRYVLYTGIAEALRTIAFRMNTDQNDSVFNDFGAELLAYDRELQMLAAEAERVGLELH